MTEHDDIRRGLEELSSHPPLRDRKAAVHERIAGVRRRRQISGGIAVSVVTLLAGIAFTSLAPMSRAPSDSSLTSPSETPTPAPTPSASSSRAVATADAKAPVRSIKATPGNVTGQSPAASKLTQTAGTTTTTTKSAIIPAIPPASTGTAAVTPPATIAPPTSKPPAPPSPSTTTSPGASPTASPGTGELLTADIVAATVADGSAAPETIVTVHLKGTIYGSLGSVMVWYTKVHHVGYTDSQASACAVQDGKLHDIDETFTFRTRYRAAGAEQIDATVITLDKSCATDATQRQWPFSAAVSIPVGSTLSNGIQPVTLIVGTSQVQSSRITVSTSANDPDGYISGFTVNWGTGTPDTFPGGNGANCSASEYGGVFWPDGGGSGTFTSRILPAGTYSVTVSAISTGCDGKDAQTAQQSLTVTVP